MEIREGLREGLGERLKRLRIERGMTQAQLADPYSSAFVSQIEGGRKFPSERSLSVFAKKLGVGVAELATGVSTTLEVEVATRLQDGWKAVYLGKYGAARSAFRGAARVARRLSDPTFRAKALIGEAWCSERRGEASDAMRLFAQALDTFRKHAPPPAAVEAVAGCARCHQMRGETTVALYVLERYLAELEEQQLCDPAAMMRIHASLVWPYLDLGLNDKAYEAASRALRLQTRVDSPEEVAGMHLNVAHALLARGETDLALQSLIRAEDIYGDLNWETEIARARTARGILLSTRARFSEARTELVRALEAFRSVGFLREEARTLNELARVERGLGNALGATDLARQALELLTEMEAVPEQALAHRELGLAVAGADEAEAERHLRRAAELYQRCGEIDHAADTYRLLGDLVARRVPHAAAEEYRAGLLLISGRVPSSD